MGLSQPPERVRQRELRRVAACARPFRMPWPSAARLAFHSHVRHAPMRGRSTVPSRSLRRVKCLEKESDILDAAREHADRVQRVGVRMNARARQEVVGRLASHHAAIGGGPYDRARGLRAEGERHHAVGDRGGRAARGTAGRMREVVRVARLRRERRSRARSDRLAQNHAARGTSERRPERNRRAADGRDRSASRTPSAGRRCRRCPSRRPGDPRSGPSREACASARSSDRNAHACTAGSRSAMRSRQLCTSACASSSPRSIRAAAAFAPRRRGSITASV